MHMLYNYTYNVWLDSFHQKCVTHDESHLRTYLKVLCELQNLPLQSSFIVVQELNNVHYVVCL